jgi:hypothetical protein
LSLESCALYFKLISHSFYRSDAINAEFLADLADMYIDSAVANNYIIAPNLAKDLITQKNAAGAGRQQMEATQILFLPAEFLFPPIPQ